MWEVFIMGVAFLSSGKPITCTFSVVLFVDIFVLFLTLLLCLNNFRDTRILTKWSTHYDKLQLDTPKRGIKNKRNLKGK